MTSGSTNSKKTVTKPQVPQSVIDNWLKNHPTVETSGFTFSKLKDLKISASTVLNKSIKSSADTKTSSSNIKHNFDLIKEKVKNPPSGFTYNLSASTSTTTKSTLANFLFSASTNENTNIVKSTGHTGPHRVKSTPKSITGETKSTPQPKMLIKSGLSLSEPATTFTAGTVDYSFPNGDGYGFTNNIYDIQVQTDGKILVGGETSQYYFYNGDSWSMQGLIRLNSDGTIDETFDITANWDCYGGGFNDSVYTIAIQTDGKILVGGGFNYFDRNGGCVSANRIIRLNSDGSRDITFNTGNGFDYDVYTIEIQPDGKILCGGYFTNYNGTTSYYIIRLNSNGSIDSSFNIGDSSKSFDNYINKIILQPDGKILCGGYFNYYSGISQNYITRLNSDGTLDTTFQIGVGFNDEVYTIAIQSDGKIVVGGYFNNFDNNDLVNGKIVRLTKNGTLDTIFNYGLNNSVYSLAIQSNDKILVGGEMSYYYPDEYNTLSIDKLIRFNADCSFDYSFYYEESFNSTVNSIAILNDGKILVGGNFNTNGDPTTYPLNYFGKLNNSITKYPYVYLGWTNFCNNYNTQTLITVGSMTPPVLSLYDAKNVYSFNVIQHPSQTKIGIALPGSNILSFGYPTNNIELVQVNDYGINNCYDAIRDNSMIAICADVFNSTPVPFPILVDKKYKLSDIGFYSYVWHNGNVPSYFHSTFQIIDLYEYNGDFVIPSEILPYMTYESPEESIKVNGQYIYVGDCHAPCGSWALSKQYDICLTGGTISYYNCTNCGLVLGELSYFSIDYSESYGEISAGTPTINSIKIWENCDDCSINNSPYGQINYNYYETAFDGDVYTIAEQPDGKLLVGGAFLNFESTNVNYIARLNADGTLDTDFNIGTGFDNYVNTIVIQPDGKILVGGSFNNYNGEFAGYIIRLNSDGSIDNNFTYSTEFNNSVYTIAVQNDGKIVVGGAFSYYYEYYCPGYVRLNSDGTPDTTFMQYLFEGEVYSILLEDATEIEYYSGVKHNYQNIIIGGYFDMYIPDLELGINCLAKFGYDGSFINTYNQAFTNYDYGVYNMQKQSNGKLICVGSFHEYQGNECPYNIIRINTDGTQDMSFVKLFSGDGGGFNDGYVNTLQILPNDKIMVGGYSTSFADVNNYYNNLGYLVRLNSDGTLDTTFTYVLDDNYVYTTLLKSNKTLLVGGAFNYYYAGHLLDMFIGEDFQLHLFNTCDGKTKNIYLPNTFDIPYTTVNPSDFNLSLMNFINDSYPVDDDYLVCDLPMGYSIDFLSSTYYSVNVSSNSYITFGDPTINGGAGTCCFSIPDGIYSDGPAQPGVYISTACSVDNLSDGLDNEAFFVYSGLTNDGNEMIIRYEGTYHCTGYSYPTSPTDLVYNFVFYKGISNYFDLQIDSNLVFYNNNPIGGTSDGSNAFIGTFNSSSNKSYRIYNDGSVTSLIKPIKADINTSNVVCGTVGDVITIPVGSTKIGGSMYFDGQNNTMVQVDNSVGQFGFGGEWDFTIEWFQYYEGGSNSRPFSIGVYGNPNEMIGMSFEGTVYLWINDSSNTTTISNSDLLNGWHHIAVTRYYNGGDHIWRVFLDGVKKFEGINNIDTSNTYTLTLGNQLNNDGKFNGYITNFRVNNLSALYLSNFTVPTAPLINIPNTILLLLSSNSNNLLTDSTYQQSVASTGVTWSSETPFLGYPEYFISSNTDTNYNNCATCTATTLYNATLLVRDGISSPYIARVTMTLDNINNILTYGPIFTNSMGGIHALNVYELLEFSL